MVCATATTSTTTPARYAATTDIAQFLRRHPHFRTVPDPYYGGEQDFETVIELLEDACEGLLDHLMNPNH